MCGRYNVTPNAQAFIDAFDIAHGIDLLPDEPRYNIAPGDDKHPTLVPIVRDSEGGRELVMVRWPFIPAWAKGKHVDYSTANAKGETLADKPTYKRAWQARRCLIPASGYYEWKKVPGQKNKQPYHIQVRDREVFAFAGLWERSRAVDGETVESCAIVTTQPSESIKFIHSRMPVILPQAAYPDWLSGSTDAAARWIKPFTEEPLQAVAISTYVNNPQHNDPRCVAPLT